MFNWDLFNWGWQQLQQQLAPQRILGGREDIRGPYCIAVTATAPYTVKRICLTIEHIVPAARLLDLDVYTAYGQRIGRVEIGAPFLSVVSAARQ
ncbi:MAG: citrate lyase holo-[acyl-carrier protein] synthase [Candidatus Competibacteraceae bacterium]|nr:citrate lyase holo-[acyl-carrier protein] synthase [Candidatus Competibacteraceae bacterium]MCB1812125.1 citrate lyase holo-[acyl-carrier protein] synthase [Candidatus Competibacteraceae bacterium]